MTERKHFRGKEILVIKNDNMKFPLMLGKTKAKLIVENFEDIKKFAEEAE